MSTNITTPPTVPTAVLTSGAMVLPQFGAVYTAAAITAVTLFAVLKAQRKAQEGNEE